MIDLDDIRAAARRLHGVAHRTPLITSRTLDELTGAHVFLKAENLQRAGALTFRGEFNPVASLPGLERQKRVATVSSGTHAQAIALASRLHDAPAPILTPPAAQALGVAARLADGPAVILTPAHAAAGKLAATRGSGAEVIRCDRSAEDRGALLAEPVEAGGFQALHPSGDPRVMAGEGTAGLEL